MSLFDTVNSLVVHTLVTEEFCYRAVAIGSSEQEIMMAAHLTSYGFNEQILMEMLVSQAGKHRLRLEYLRQTHKNIEI